MPWWASVVTTIASTIVIPAVGWIVVKILHLEKEFTQFKAETQQRLIAAEQEFAERLEWLHEMNLKLDKVSEDTAHIRGLLEGQKTIVRT